MFSQLSFHMFAFSEAFPLTVSILVYFYCFVYRIIMKKYEITMTNVSTVHVQELIIVVVLYMYKN